MDYLPAELLVNIFERLNVADSSKCRLMNRRFNEILQNNWKKIQREKVKLTLFTTEKEKEYSVWISEEIIIKWARKRIEVVKANNKNNVATILAKIIGAAPPISNTICFSDKNAAVAGIFRLAQQKYCIDTLHLSLNNPNTFEGIVSVLPENTVEHLSYEVPKSSDEVLYVMRKLGKEHVRSISIHNISRNEFDLTLLDSLIPQIPFKNLYAPYYVTSVSTVMSVIQSWVDSEWSNMWSLLRTTEEIWYEITKICIIEYGIVNHFTRKADNRKLYVTFQNSHKRRGDMLVRLFDDLKYEEEFLQLPWYTMP